MSTPLDQLELEALLVELNVQGVRLSADGPLLRYDAPAGMDRAELEAALGRHKEALLAWASGTPVVLAQGPVSEGPSEVVLRHAVEARPETWNVAAALDLRGPLDPQALHTALTRLVARHESLHSRFRVTDEGVRQEVLLAREVELPLEDLRDQDPEARDARVEEACAWLAGTPFDLSEGSQPRFRLLRRGTEDWRLVLVLHHGSCDGHAFSVLVRELSVLYRQALGQAVPALPPAPSCLAQGRRAAEHSPGDAEYRRRLAYWAAELGDASPDSGLPTDHPRPARLSGAGASESLTLAPEVRARLERFARRHETTPFAVTLAVISQLTVELTGRGDLALNTSYANRPDSADQELVCCTAIALPLRIRLTSRDTLPEVCAHVHERLVEGIGHLLPLQQVTEGVARHHDQTVPTPVPFSMTYQSTLDADLQLPDVHATLVDLHPPSARRDAGFIYTPRPDGSAEVLCVYSTDLFRAETVRSWLSALTRRFQEL